MDGPEIQHRTVEFTAADGAELTGDLALPLDPVAGAVLCHPHPEYGGNRFNVVVQALYDALPTAGIAALRFDFRREFGGGVAEVGDADAAVETLAAEGDDLPVIAIGYSFGAMVTLALAHPRVIAKVAIAPPLTVMEMQPGMDVPTLVLTPDHDQFTPTVDAAPIVESWPDAELHGIAMADHFLTGRTAAVAAQTLDWLRRRRPPSPGAPPR